jgi:hypothetical protein
MKAVLLASAVLVSTSLAAFGQGQFAFNNRVPPDINARFIAYTDPPSGAVSSIGSDYRVELFKNNFDGTLTPLDPSATTFRGSAGSDLAGYVTPTTETVPGVAPGANASIVVRVLGPIAGGRQDFGPYTVPLGGGTITPPNLPLGTTPLVVGVPEPSQVVLVLGGIGAVLLARSYPKRTCKGAPILGQRA